MKDVPETEGGWADSPKFWPSIWPEIWNKGVAISWWWGMEGQDETGAGKEKPVLIPDYTRYYWSLFTKWTSVVERKVTKWYVNVLWAISPWSLIELHQYFWRIVQQQSKHLHLPLAACSVLTYSLTVRSFEMLVDNSILHSNHCGNLKRVQEVDKCCSDYLQSDFTWNNDNFKFLWSDTGTSWGTWRWEHYTMWLNDNKE